MTIKKIGHCCLLIKLKNLTILTDPGVFSTGQDEIKGIDVVLITHEHADHFHVESLKKIMANNPQVQVIANTAVGKILAGEGVAHEVLDGRASKEVSGILIEAFDCQHEEIFEEIGQVQNTGYFINRQLFYPGDSFGQPGREVEILALPVAGPWCKMADAIRYALSVKPRVAFPVHDAVVSAGAIGFYHQMPQSVLESKGVKFVPLLPGDEREFPKG